MPYDHATIVAANRAVQRLAGLVERCRTQVSSDHPLAVGMMAELDAVTRIVGDANAAYAKDTAAVDPEPYA